VATGHGNSVPRFHVVWGTGPGVVEPFARKILAARAAGRAELRWRHRVDALITNGGRVVGVRGDVLAPSPTPRGAPSSREVVGEFELRADAVIVAAGGIGANHELVRKNWPERCGTPPRRLLSGVPDYVDGSMLGVV